ncbi:hypothetical protein [Actinomadura flavalba]|uniref:hypothetical protein n=1 Tax=Actinomadura flavalba TaxID=1120938 RepID=UPI0003A1BFAE|nr:hypothetical protein [Actinomadura flavalba]
MKPADAAELEEMDKVDVHPDVHRATEPDEDQILRDLYGEPDAEGVFRGAAIAPHEDPVEDADEGDV